MRNVMDGSITNNHTGTELRPHLVTMQNLDKLHFKDIQQILTFTFLQLNRTFSQVENLISLHQNNEPGN